MELQRFLRNFDWVLLATTLALMVVGVVFIASASGSSLNLSNLQSMHLAIRQAIYGLVALVIIAVVAAIDYTWYRSYSNLLYLLNLALMVLVLVIGHSSHGAQSWIGLGPVQLQPSEIAKVLVILTLANFLARRDPPRSLMDLVLPGLHVGLPIVLLLLQPDLGTSLVYVAIFLVMIYAAGYPGWKLLLVGSSGLALACGVIAAQVYFHLDKPLKPYQLNRLIVFLNPEGVDPLGSGYQLIQSKIAVGSGQLWGNGLFHSLSGQLSYLPERHNDFIFAVIGQETGFIGATVVLVLFIIYMWRGVVISAEARDRFGVILTSGVVGMIFAHVLINVGMTIGLMPITGLPLPFISYGGSSLVTVAFGTGLLLSVCMRRKTINF